MSLTPNIFVLVKDFLASNLLGSIVLFGVFVIAILVVLILAAKLSVKVGLVIIFPAILAIMGIGINQGLLGTNYRWIGILLLVGLAIGVFALIWNRISE